MHKQFLTLGSILMALAVGLGAFGAHGLKNILSPEMISVFETGVTYHFYHALGLLALGIVAHFLPSSSLFTWSGWLMFAGIIIFSGSLYLLSISGTRWLGAITPIGGLCFIVAWLLFATAIWKGM